jgi:hypothetical protein
MEKFKQTIFFLLLLNEKAYSLIRPKKLLTYSAVHPQTCAMALMFTVTLSFLSMFDGLTSEFSAFSDGFYWSVIFLLS